MAIEIKAPLTENEIKFVERYEAELLPNKQHLNTALLAEVAALVGITVCHSCRKNAVVSDVINHYNSFLLKTMLA